MSWQAMGLQRAGYPGSTGRGWVRPAAMAVSAAAMLLLCSGSLWAELVRIPHGYHWQQTNFYCGTASIQMMLDTPAVRNNNPAVDAYFANNVYQPALRTWSQDQQIQNQIYQASRDRRNQFYPVGYHPGTDPVVFSYTINAYDGIANGPALPGGVAQGANTNNHAYGWYGFVPTNFAAEQASRTVAYALKNYDVPASVAVGRGAHWVVVDGVNTLGNISTPANPNNQFQILGFRVSDPWTGYAFEQKRLKQANPNNPNIKVPTSFGMGVHAWYRYGFNAAAQVTEENPDGYKRQGAWFNYFDPVRPGPYPFSGQFNIVVEPEPTAPFDPDDEEYFSQPDPYAILSNPVTSVDAYSYAQSALAGDFSFLSSEFAGGTWDTSNISLFSFPDDPSGIGDWMIPYVGPGGTDDVLGAIMIDSLSGTVNQAMWFGEVPSVSLDDLTGFYNSLYALDIPLSAIPEPASLLLVAVAAVVFVGMRRRILQAAA